MNLMNFGPRSPETADMTPVPLRSRDVDLLRLGWSSNFTARELEQHLREHPDLSWWVPANGEYLVGGPWRHRDEIAVIQELAARIHTTALVDAFTQRCRERGLRLVVMLDQHETRRESFYTRIGFDLLQNIVVYELPRLPRSIPAPERLRFEPITRETLDELFAVDHAAFPWLWWNSPVEFASYAGLYGVEIFLGREPDSTPVAYVGITSYRGWGHLDRIAVIPDRQGLGYGLETLNFAIGRLAEQGARRVGLSTQADNIRSQHLYERYGFHRTAGSDYLIYGKWLDEEERSKA